MADFEIKNNPQFSETLRKLETTDKAHASIFNRLYEALLDNDNYLIKKADESGTKTTESLSEISVQIQNLEKPEFDDEGSVEGITNKTTLLANIVSKMPLVQFMRNVKAGFKLALYAGELVNNCVTDRSDLPLSAAQGKALMDLYTVLNTNLNKKQDSLSLPTNTPVDYPDFSGGSGMAKRGGWVDEIKQIAYYNLKMSWVLIQFRASSGKVEMRLCWGDSTPTYWKQIIP